jgi:hypothetical protein
MIINAMDALFRQTCPVECDEYSIRVAFNLFRGSKILKAA